jgi:RNA polymerase sigma-70 factor (ECF subfamily)
LRQGRERDRDMLSLLRASMPASFARAGELARPDQTRPTLVDTFEGLGRSDSIPGSRDPRDDLAETVGPLLGLLTRASRRILHDDSLADDAIQETLLAFWARGERLENPRAWLLHAVTLRSLQLARTCRRRREHERRACLGHPEWSLRDDPARSLDHADLLRILGDSLGRVPDECRSVFVLFALEEMDYAGIAERLHIPIGTVRSRLSRTRRVIRESLSNRPAPRHLPPEQPDQLRRDHRRHEPDDRPGRAEPQHELRPPGGPVD